MTTPSPKDEVLNEIRGFRQQMAGEHTENVKRLDKMDERMARMEAGFPGGDPDGHRRYHEMMIEEMEDKKKLRRELMAHVIKSSTWAALGGVVWFVITRAKDWLILLAKGM